MSSIRSKIFYVIISFLAILCIAFSFYVFSMTKNYRKLKLESLTALLQDKSERINTAIVEMQQDSLSLANAARVFLLYTERSPEVGKLLVQNNLLLFQSAAGAGIWFEPNEPYPGPKPAGYFAEYKEGETVPTTSDASKNIHYRDENWYRTIRKGLDRRGRVVWSQPYLKTNGKDNLVITVGTGIYGAGNQLSGIATVDWKIQNVINEIGRIKPTPNSFILMCDREHDYILVHTGIRGMDARLRGGSLKTLPWYENLTGVSRMKTSVTSFIISGAEFYSFARVLNNGMLIAIQVPASELFHMVDLQNNAFIAIFMLFSLLMLYGAMLAVSRFITTPIRNLIRDVTRLGQGNLDHKVPEKANDELGLLARTFNRMADNLKDHIGRLERETASRERITSELEVAAQIQKDILPNTFPPFPDVLDKFDLYAEMHPAKEVAGDFYDFFRIDANRIGFVIADVSGKGIPAAMFMMSAKTTLKNNALSGIGTAKIIERTNKALCENNDICMFVCVFFGIYDLSTHVLHYVNCGQNPPILQRNENSSILNTGKSSPPLGLEPKLEYRSRKLRMKPGDRLFCYTDGVTEAMNRRDEVFGEKRLISRLKGMPADQPLAEELHGVMESVRRFAGEREQSDDVTMLILEIRG